MEGIKNKLNYNGIDLFKFIGALLVLLLHANPFGLDTGAGVILREVITPIAVPFFFTASGFLWYRSYTNQGFGKGLGKIRHTYKLYCIWSLIYLPFVFVTWFINGSIGISSVLTLAKNFVFEGTYLTIWYLNALWSALLIMLVLLKKFKPWHIFLISVPFYVLSCALSSWNGLFVEFPLGQEITNLYYSFFETTKNGLLDGFLFVSLGAVVYEMTREDKPHKNHTRAYYVAGFVLSFIFMVAEYIVRIKLSPAAKGCDIVLGTVPVAFFSLQLALNCTVKNSELCVKMRTYSTLLFLTQRIPLTLFSWADSFIDKFMGISIFSNDLVYFLSVTIATFVISFILIKLSGKFKFISILF